MWAKFPTKAKLGKLFFSSLPSQNLPCQNLNEEVSRLWSFMQIHPQEQNYRQIKKLLFNGYTVRTITTQCPLPLKYINIYTSLKGMYADARFNNSKSLLTYIHLCFLYYCLCLAFRPQYSDIKLPYLSFKVTFIVAIAIALVRRSSIMQPLCSN